MRTIKKVIAVGAVTVLLVAGAGIPAQAANGGRVQPQSPVLCDMWPWLPWC